MAMSFLENGILSLMKTVSIVLDVFSYIPYYIIQRHGEVLRKSNEQKAILVGGPDGYYRDVSADELTNTPDADCQTIPELFEKACMRYGNAKCVGTREFFREEEEVQPNGKVFKKSILGDYEWKTYVEVLDEVKWLGRGLTSTGMTPGTCILIFAETRADWMIAAQACFRQNFPVVTLYATLGDEAVIYGINEAEVTHVITSGDLLPKFKKLLARTPTVKHITYMQGKNPVNPKKIAEGSQATIMSMEEVMSRGKASSELYVDTMPLPNDTAVVMYTSGSTGQPKGVLLSHVNVLASMSGLLDRAKIRPTDVYVGYLPLAHILELCAEIACLYSGCSIGYSSPNTLSDASTAIKKGAKGDVSILRPTLLACVPTVMDRIYKNVWDKVNSGGLVKRVLFNFAVYYKRKWIARGGDCPLINFIVMSAVRNLLGGRVRAMLSGGAPLNPETQEFLRLSLCCPIVQGYGLTETCCAGAIASLDDLNIGHVGAPISCCRFKLVSWEEGNYRNTDNPPSGEIWIGGPNVGIGYFKNPEKTKEDFTDLDELRWFKTGDIGMMRPDGTFTIVDRKKDLVKLQAGEYVSLGKVEASLKLSPYVDNICVFGNSMHMYTVAIIVPNPKAIQELANSLSFAGDWASLCENSEVRAKVLKEIQSQGVKGGLEKFEIPRDIRLTADVWTPDTGLVTDALKLKRKPLSDKYKDLVQSMYLKSLY